MVACSGASPLIWAAALANAAQSVPHGIGPSEWKAESPHARDTSPYRG